MKDVTDQIAALGYSPGHFNLDGKIHRFNSDPKDKKKSGWVLGFQNHTIKTGEHFKVVLLGNFRTGENHTIHAGTSNLSAADKANVKKQIELAKRLSDKIRRENQESVADDVERAWSDNLLENGISDYLKQKQISAVKNLGVKYDIKGNVYVPARDATNKFWSWQKIQANGEKRFYKGGRIDGSFHLIGDINSSETVYLTEGFATAASIYFATDKPVAISFHAHNLLKVAQTIKKKYQCNIIVCGDNDKWTTRPSGELWNPGKEKALETAKRVFGTAVFPKFKCEKNRPTDFNDLHIAEGIGEVKRQLTKVKEPEKYAVYALGLRDNDYYFTSTSNKQIVTIRAFTEDAFLNLMPFNYWLNEFPSEKTEKVDWTAAKDTLMSQSRKRGFFKGSMVRGAGTWLDEGRIVLNMGTHLVVNGERIELQDIKSRFIYTLTHEVKPLHPNPLTFSEARKLGEVCHSFKWTKADSGTLLVGILALSRVCGALPIRPHCWITGGAQTGKTTLLERLVSPILGSETIYAHSGTTEAGLRQTLRANAFPVLFDEFETNGQKSDANIAACIELMRAAWASSGAMILKGTPGGSSQKYQACFSAIVSSIRTSLVTDADRGRFAILELAPHGSDEEHWKKLSAALSEIDDEFCDRFYARIVNMLPVILENFKVIKKAFARLGGARYGDQYGMILAGVSVVSFDGVLSDDDAEWLAQQLEPDDAKSDDKITDHDEALQHLLSTKIPVQLNERRAEMLIGDIIRDALSNRPATERVKPPGEAYTCEVKVRPDSLERKQALQNIGIKVLSKLDYVAIRSAGHAELARIWRGTKWSANWSTPLSRVGGAKKGTVRMGKTENAIKIPARVFLT